MTNTTNTTNLIPTDHTEAAACYHEWRRLDKAVKKMAADLKAYVDEHGDFPVSESSTYCRVLQNEEHFAAEHADFVPTLERLLPPIAVDAAIKRSCPKTSFDAACKLAAALTKEDAKAIRESVTETLRSVDLVKTVVKTVYKEVRTS